MLPALKCYSYLPTSIPLHSLSLPPPNLFFSSKYSIHKFQWSKYSCPVPKYSILLSTNILQNVRPIPKIVIAVDDDNDNRPLMNGGLWLKWRTEYHCARLEADQWDSFSPFAPFAVSKVMLNALLSCSDPIYLFENESIKCSKFPVFRMVFKTEFLTTSWICKSGSPPNSNPSPTQFMLWSLYQMIDLPKSYGFLIVGQIFRQLWPNWSWFCQFPAYKTIFAITFCPLGQL